MPPKITKRQQDILDFIRTTIAARGMPPTLREIGGKFGILSTNGVDGHLSALEARGLIRRDRGKSRGILLRPADRPTVSIPLLGRVAAGQPVLSPENREGEVVVDLSLFALRSPNNIFALRVKGESMVNAHILDNDLLIVRAQSSARDGEVVVALWDGEATVKRFFAERNRVRLQPENNAMSPLFVDRGELLILGKAIGVIRRL